MDWLMPASVNDPSDDWRKEEATLKDSMTSQATRDDLPPDTWTGYLVWTYTPTTASTLNAGFYCLSSSWQYEIDYHDGDAWSALVCDIDPYGTLPLEFDFDPVRIEMLRFRLRNLDDDAADALAFRFKIGADCTGPLAPLCGLFHGVADFFEDVAENIEGIWLLGDYLSPPFNNIAEALNGMGDTCCEVSATLGETLELFEGGVTWDELTSLIQDHWPWLYNLANDPVGWFLAQLALAFDLDLDDAQSLESLAALVLSNHFPILYYLATDPKGEMLYLVGQLFELEPYEAQSAEFVIKALFERYFPTQYLAWREIEEWRGLHEREGAVGVMTELKARFYSLAERGLRFLWEGIW